MGVNSLLLRWLRQLVMLLFIFCFLTSGILLNIIQFIILPLYWINRRLYRILNCKIVYFHWALIPWATETWAGYNIRIFVEDPKEFPKYANKEHALCVLNHRGDMDWMIGWCLIDRIGMLGGTKAIMKDVAKFVPGIGWMFHFLEYPIIKRTWERDKERLKASCDSLADYPVNMLLCLFAEGTRFTPEKHKVSLEIAEKKGFPKYKHHLLPRPKGFTFIVKNMRDTIPAIYDITFGYREGEPSILGVIDQVSCSCDILIRRFSTHDVPIDNDENTTKWLNQLYQDKDDFVDYHVHNKTFPPPYKEYPVSRRPWPNVVMAMWFLLLFVPVIVLAGYLVWTGAWYLVGGVIITLLVANQGFFMIIKLTEVRHASKHGLVDTSSKKNNKIPNGILEKKQL